MSDKFMPKKPDGEAFLEYYEAGPDYPIIDSFNEFIANWWQKEIEPLFKDAVRVTGHLYENGAVDFGSGNDCGDTHEALLIGIRPIEKPKPKTDSENLDDILQAFDDIDIDTRVWFPKELVKAIERARKS